MKINLSQLLILSLSIFLFTQNIYGQTKLSNDHKVSLLDKTTIWVNAGGHGLVYSFALEHILFNNDNKLSLQIGVAYYPIALEIIPVWIPVTFNQMIALNSKKHFIEVGAGLMLNGEQAIGDRQLTWAMDDIIFRLGYRNRNPEKRFDWRIAFTPIVHDFVLGDTVFSSRRGSTSQPKSFGADIIVPTFEIGFGWRL